MYDWANSVYSLNITSSIFPAYYQAVTKNPASLDKVKFLGFSVTNSVLYSYALSFAFLCVVAVGPLLGGIADYYGRKKLFMQLFCTLGSIACMGLYFFTGENIHFGILMLVIATIGYAGSLVFYNAFLPEIATPKMTDQISAKGFSYGYVGSVLLLIFNLTMLLMPEFFFNIDSALASRISFLTVGLWWFGFAQYTFSILPETQNKNKNKISFIWTGFSEIKRVFIHVQNKGLIKGFLTAFFVYSMGVQTVMYVATLLGEKEFHLVTSQLITVVLILQIIAIVGANLAAWLSGLKGNIFALSVIMCIWIFICMGAYLMQNGTHFYMLAVLVGLVMGAVQSLSRSTYSKLIPANTKDHASYFSFYDVTEKLATVLGTFCYGLVEQVSGNMRNSVIALGIFFLAGLCVLYFSKKHSFYEP